jgi:hypothetical protein
MKELQDLIAALRERTWLSPVSAEEMNRRDRWLADQLDAALRAWRRPADVPNGAVLAAEHFENMVRETAGTLTQIEKRQLTQMLGDEAHLIAHYKRNLEYFTVRAEGIREALRAWRRPQETEKEENLARVAPLKAGIDGQDLPQSRSGEKSSL